MTNFFFLPTIMLSGIMFPFAGLPRWAEIVSEGPPLTHFARITSGINIERKRLGCVANDVVALCAITLVAMTVAVTRFRATLD